MSDTRITEQRKWFVEALGESPRITFADLKKKLVGKWDSRMNLATLYRIVDAFKAQGLIHEMTIAGERLIFPCQCGDATPTDAITITFCENCGAVYDQHTRITAPYTMMETFARVKSCNACVIR